MKIYNSNNNKSLKLTKNSRGLPVVIFQDINTDVQTLKDNKNVDEKTVYFTLRTSQKFIHGIKKLLNNEIENFIISYKSAKNSKDKYFFGIFKRDGKFYLDIVRNEKIVNSFEFSETPFEYNYDSKNKRNTVDTTMHFDLMLFSEWIKAMTHNTLIYETIKPTVRRKFDSRDKDQTEDNEEEKEIEIAG